MSEPKTAAPIDETSDDENEDSQRDKYLTFRIANEDFAIDIGRVVEIVGIQAVTVVPDMPDFVRGIINLRGRVIPAFDVRARFGMQSREYDARTCMIVVDLKGTSVALIVDTVNEVLSIPADKVSPPPSVQGGRSSRFVRAMGRVGEVVKIILDLDRLLLDGEQQALTEMAV